MEGNLTKTLEKYLPYVGKKHELAYIYPCTLIGKQMKQGEVDRSLYKLTTILYSKGR